MGYEPTVTPLLIYFSTNFNAVFRVDSIIKFEKTARILLEETVYPFTVLLRVLCAKRLKANYHLFNPLL